MSIHRLDRLDEHITAKSDSVKTSLSELNDIELLLGQTVSTEEFNARYRPHLTGEKSCKQ